MPDNSSESGVACPLCDSLQTHFYFQYDKNHQHHYNRCEVCDVVFVLPSCRLGIEQEKARYDMHQNDYSEPYINFLSRLANPILDELTKSSSVQQGLDFGSGKSQAMAEIFRQSGYPCVCYDIFYYPEQSLLSNKYDFIVASEVIEHLYQPKQVIEQWLALLNPEGVLGIMTTMRPNDEEFPNWWYKNDPTHVMLFSQTTFDFLQRQYGLTCVFTGKNIWVFRRSSSSD